CCLPISTLRPRSWVSERSSFSVLPSRRVCESEVPAIAAASAASAPAFFAFAIRSCSRLRMSCPSLSGICTPASFPDRLTAARQAVACPFPGHFLDHRVGHADRRAPGSGRFGRQLGGGVEADLATQ